MVYRAGSATPGGKHLRVEEVGARATSGERVLRIHQCTLLDTAEVADRYVAAFRTGRLDAALKLMAPDVERLAPFLAPDQFAVRFTFDETHTPTETRDTTSKISLCTVTTGHITREEVYYYNSPSH